MAFLIDGFEGFQVVAEAGDRREAVRLAWQLEPDIALLDSGMPGLNGLDAAALIAREALGTQIVVLSMAEPVDRARNGDPSVDGRAV